MKAARPVAAWWPVWLRDRGGLAAAGAGVYVAAYVAWTFLTGGEAAERAFLSNLAFLPMSLLATAAAARVASHPRLEAPIRRAWAWLALCLAAYFFGDLIFFILDAVQPEASAGISLTLADGLYLAFYPFALLGLLNLPGAPGRSGERLRFAFDLGIVMVTAWMVVWYFVISPGAPQTHPDPDPLSRIVAAAYPIGDLVVLAGLVVLLYRGQDATTRSTLVLLAIALLNFVASDLAYAYTRVTGVYVAGGWVDVGWITAYLFFLLAALRQPFLERGSRTERWSAGVLRRVALLLPLAAIIVGYSLVLTIEVTRTPTDERVLGLFASAGLLTVLVTARQGLALADNQRLNAELRALSAELEARVAERTRQLQQAQTELLESQKLAIVGTLAAEVVHEVSNPVNLILNAGETLEAELDEKGEVDRGTLAEFLPIINRAGWQATRILRSLRSFSRGGALELVPQRLSDVVADTLLLVGHRIGKNPTIRVITDVPADLPPVMCDRNQMAQVLFNLINNARDAMPNGGTLTLRARPAPGGVALEVIDTGVGMPPEVLAQIFRPFFTTKPIGQGSGLGLSIVERIMREHGGSVTAASAGPGQGSTITLTLPAVGPPAAAGDDR